MLIEKDDGSANATRGFVYNDNGNTVQDAKPDGTLLDLHYNAMNRYNQMDIDNAPTAWYQHNALGQRVKKTTLSDVVYYHYDESDQLLAESDNNGNVLRDYVYADTMRVARYDGTTPYYFHNDHLGRPIALTDGLGNVAWQVDYLPFGEVYTVINNTTDNALGFPGQILDVESGFFYNYYRDYDLSSGRYIQADPLGILLFLKDPQRIVSARLGVTPPLSKIGRLNKNYIYVESTPFNLIDPLGEGCWIEMSGMTVWTDTCKNDNAPFPSGGNGDAFAFPSSTNDDSCGCPSPSIEEGSNKGDLVCVAVGAGVGVRTENILLGAGAEVVCTVTIGDAINAVDDYLQCIEECKKNKCK